MAGTPSQAHIHLCLESGVCPSSKLLVHFLNLAENMKLPCTQFPRISSGLSGQVTYIAPDSELGTSKLRSQGKNPCSRQVAQIHGIHSPGAAKAVGAASAERPLRACHRGVQGGSLGHSRASSVLLGWNLGCGFHCCPGSSLAFFVLPYSESVNKTRQQFCEQLNVLAINVTYG